MGNEVDGYRVGWIGMEGFDVEHVFRHDCSDDWDDWLMVSGVGVSVV